MTKRTRQNHSGSFNAKVALTVLRGEKTLIEIAEQFEVHPTHVTEWKKQLLERASNVFAGSLSAGKGETGPDFKVLHAKMGCRHWKLIFEAARSPRSPEAQAIKLQDAREMGKAHFHLLAIAP